MIYNIQSSSNNTEAGECESQFIGMQGRICGRRHKAMRPWGHWRIRADILHLIRSGARTAAWYSWIGRTNGVCPCCGQKLFALIRGIFTGDRASKSRAYDSQHTPLCSSDRDRRDTDGCLWKWDPLSSLLPYQPSISKATAHFNTDRQTDRSIRDWCEASYPYRSNTVLHPLTLCLDVIIPWRDFILFAQSQDRVWYYSWEWTKREL